ncbi:FecCD family ABC transporter permease [Companilactobacillus keshanensis]|uniref:FecCD family ABC transporter permease n=1 Tax=Companilactobacillus keshanensis TaxID=2486003 RepID=A0ABW4BS85_9LACO|nr:iron ABC transporter permease [Companilactobacillus keshanensis]
MNQRLKFSIHLIVSLLLLAILIILSIRFGANKNESSTVFNAIFHFQKNNVDQQIIRNIRIPRVIGAVLIGVALAGSGVLMQSITKNPMADSGILGINSGAALMLTVSFAFFPHLSTQGTTIFSILGAAFTSILVFVISSLKKSQMSPTILVLSGMAISAFFTAISEGLALLLHLKQDLAFWHFGGVSAVSWVQLKNLGPWIAIGIVILLFLAPSMNLLHLSDDSIKSLGRNINVIRILALICVVILSGISVSLVGAVAFVGLIIPHIAKFLIGTDYRQIIPLTLILGADLTVCADLIARTINPPNETPFGLIISLVGVPFFIYLARKDGNNA